MKKIKFKSLLKLKVAAFALISLISACAGSDNSAWIWDIDGNKYTVNNLNAAHEGAIFLMAMQMGADPEELKKALEEPEKAPNPQLKMMLMGLSKERYAETYKQLILMNMEAQKNGFTEREDVKQKLDFVRQFYIANMYMMDKLNVESIEITEAEAIQAWDVIRKQPQYKGVPITQGLAMTKQYLKKEKLDQLQRKVIDDIRDAYPIKNNGDFDLKKYISEEKKPAESEDKPSEDKAEK